MEGTLETVTLWTWPDGWRLVRPVDKWSFWKLYSRLCNEAVYTSRVGEYEDLSINEKGGGCSLFFLRPVSIPVGARTQDQEDGVCGMLFLSLGGQPSRGRKTSPGKLLPEFRPGLYRPVVLETLRHLYDVLIVLDLVICNVFTDRHEYLFLPEFGTSSGEEHRRNFVRDVAYEVSGASVSNFRTNWGWSSLDIVTTKDKVFEKTTYSEVAATHRERHRKGSYWLKISVPLRDGEWRPKDGSAFDLRPWLGSAADSAYWRKQAWPASIPPDSARVPWTVKLSSWEEEATDLDLEEALVRVGIIARDEAGVRAVAARRSIRGTPHPSFELPLLLGEVPSLLVVPMRNLGMFE